MNQEKRNRRAKIKAKENRIKRANNRASSSSTKLTPPMVIHPVAKITGAIIAGIVILALALVTACVIKEYCVDHNKSTAISSDR